MNKKLNMFFIPVLTLSLLLTYNSFPVGATASNIFETMGKNAEKQWLIGMTLQL